MQLGARASTVLTLAMVGAVGAAVFWAVSSSKTMVTCEMAPGGTELRGRAIYYIDFARQVMASTEDDRPVTVSVEAISWNHVGPAPDGHAQVTEAGRIDRRTGALVLQRKLVAANGAVDETTSTGRCSGLK
jgi:hypothetical protein